MAASKTQTRQDAGIPQQFWRTLDALVEKAPGVVACRTFLASPGLFLVLFGGTGTGKSVGACAALEASASMSPRAEDFHFVADRVVEGPPAKSWRPRFICESDLLRASRFDGTFWDPLRAADPLFIDEVGRGPRDSKGWGVGVLLDLLGVRYDAARKTILATNLTREDFTQQYLALDGGRLLDRLRVSGSSVTLGGPSLRVAQGVSP